MLKSFYLYLSFIAMFLSLACDDNANPNSTGPVAPNMKEMYQQEGKWEGRYLASLPCNDCDELITMLQINEDLSYILKYSYKGKSKEIVEFKGFIQWVEQDKIFKIGDPTLGEKVSHYKIIAGGLLQLDENANPYVGEDSLQFKFAKLETSLGNKYWELSEMMGLNVNGPLSSKEPFLLFDDSMKTFKGYGKCNAFNGSFEFLPNQTFRVSNLGSTRKNCEDIEQEKAFLLLLESAKHYHFTLDTLQLGKDSGIADLVFVFNPFK